MYSQPFAQTCGTGGHYGGFPSQPPQIVPQSHQPHYQHAHIAQQVWVRNVLVKNIHKSNLVSFTLFSSVYSALTACSMALTIMVHPYMCPHFQPPITCIPRHKWLKYHHHNQYLSQQKEGKRKWISYEMHAEHWQRLDTEIMRGFIGQQLILTLIHTHMLTDIPSSTNHKCQCKQE